MKKEHRCPLCESKKTKELYKTSDYYKTQEVFSIVCCGGCFVLFTDPFLENKRLLDYYDTKNYPSYQKKNTFFDTVYSFVQKRNNIYKINILKKHSKGTLLDYGAGAGSFVEKTHRCGFDSYGYEPINKTNNERIFNKKSLIKKKKYDWITLWHVLEHTKEPLVVLNEIKSLLKKEGRVAVALPNVDSYDNFYYKKHWAGYDVPRHFYHFNNLSFGFLAKKAGLQIISKHPLFYDAFYVSILSERYKKTPFSFFVGFLVGCLSNLYASFNKKHSSIIYIMKK